MSSTFVKDADERLPYAVDWSAWLANEDGDTIATVTWVVPTGIVQDTAAHTATEATAWFSGGTLGKDYDVTCRVTTTAGRVRDQTLRFKIRVR